MSEIRKRVSLLVTVCLTAAVLTACGEKEQKEILYDAEVIAPEEANYKTSQVREGEFLNTETGDASVVYWLWANLSWDNGSSYYQDILVSSGTEVKKGDVLATFDIKESHAQMEELKLQLTRKQEALVTGKKERNAAIEAARRQTWGLTSHELSIANLQVEKLQTQYEQYVYQAEKEIQQLKENIAALEEEISDNTLKAPFDGIIDSVASVNAGDPVDVGKVLVTMYSTEKYYLVADDSAGNFRYNMEVTLEGGPKEERSSFTGHVVSASNILPGTVGVKQAWIEVDEEIAAADIEDTQIKYECILEDVPNVLLVDKSAVKKENGGYYVYVLEDNVMKKRYVVTKSTNFTETWILDGLSTGQSLIID